MGTVLDALSTLAPGRDTKHRSFYTRAEWEAILARWESGVSSGRLYDVLKDSGNMPYKSQRSFYRALENQRDHARLHK